MAKMRRGRSIRGFAAMDTEKQREIASLGGKAAHAEGTAHEFTPQEASSAGRKGGQIVSRDRKHMAEIGRIGGLHRSRTGRASVTRTRSAAKSTGSSAKQQMRRGRAAKR
jgi:general stress protein YciG